MPVAVRDGLPGDMLESHPCNLVLLNDSCLSKLQCRPEYKIPGLYVIDSIVRSSRHQFGPEKDVFAPRFSKNIVQTIQHVLKCQQEEKVCKCNKILSIHFQKTE